MKKLFVCLFLLLGLPLLAQNPIWRNSWSTNRPGTAVIGQDNLSVTNQGSGTNWQFFGTSGATIARFYDVSNIAQSVSGSASNQFWFTNPAAPNSISNSYDVKMESNVTVMGTMGIGTNAPSGARAHVFNPTNLYARAMKVEQQSVGTVTTSPLLLKLHNPNAGISGTFGPGIQFAIEDTVNPETFIGRIAVQHNNSAINYDMAFSVNSVSKEIMRLKTDGSVGIGTTVPGAKLQVTTTNGDPVNAFAVRQTNGGVGIVVLSTNGYVGIGTNVPQSLLHVANLAANSDPAICLANDVQNWRTRVYGSGSDQWELYDVNNSKVSLGAAVNQGPVWIPGGLHSTNSIGSTVLGVNAGISSQNTNGISLGYFAGYQSMNSYDTICFGYTAGYRSSNSFQSIFTGTYSGRQSTNSYNSIFDGYSTGFESMNSYDSIFDGTYAGNGSSNSYNSVFDGYFAGNLSTNSYNSVFEGFRSGYNSSNTHHSVFIGNESGTNTSRPYTLSIGTTGRGTNSLIYGEFDTPMLRISGTLIATTNAGIGKEVPTAFLNVSNTAGNVDAFRVDALNEMNSLMVKSNGFVGIGVANPTSKLQINTRFGSPDYAFAISQTNGNISMVNLSSNGWTALGTNWPDAVLQVNDTNSYLGPWPFAGGFGMRQIGNFAANCNTNAAVLLYNGSAGQYSDMRLAVVDDSDHYLSFSQAGRNSVQVSFGATRKTNDMIFNGGGDPRNLLIGTLAETDVIIGANAIRRAWFKSNGRLGLGTEIPTATFNVTNVAGNVNPLRVDALNAVDALVVRSNGMVFVRAETNGVAPPTIVAQPLALFGSMMKTTTNTVVIGSADTFYVITNWTTLRTNGFSCDPGYGKGFLTNAVSGYYRVSGAVAAIPATASETFELSVFLDETGRPEIGSFGTYDNPARVRTLPLTGGVLYIAAGTGISLRICNRTAAHNVDIWRASLTVGTP